MNIERKLRLRLWNKKIQIQEVIKPGQVVLIQVIKEERGTKRSCVNYIYFTSRKIHGVDANTPKGGGISRKILIQTIDKK